MSRHTETPLPDLHTVAFYCMVCDAPSWAREWEILDPAHALVELSAECRHIALTHIIMPEQVLAHRTTGESAVLLEVPDNDQQRRDVARCRAMASTTGTRCRNDADLNGLCRWHAGVNHQIYYRHQLPVIGDRLS